MTSKHWLALAIVGSGAVSLTVLTLFAKGKQREAFVLAFAAGTVSTVFAAARALSEDDKAVQANAAPKPSDLVDSSSYGVAGLRRRTVPVQRLMLSPADIERLAVAYENAPDSTGDPRVQAMVRAERARINAAFEQLPIAVQFVDHDPYKSFEHMREQIQSTGTMYVYKGGSDTPLWDHHTNWKARAVHDFDHLQKACDFSIEGEAAAFRSSAAQCNALAPRYMSEILLQAAVANARGQFAEQKLVLVDPVISKWAQHLRGLRGMHAAPMGGQPQDISVLVWTAAGIMRIDTPEAAVVHLRAMGLDFVTIAVVIDAAAQLNVAVDQLPY